jgi:hypothetical protein
MFDVVRAPEGKNHGYPIDCVRRVNLKHFGDLGSGVVKPVQLRVGSG